MTHAKKFGTEAPVRQLTTARKAMASASISVECDRSVGLVMISLLSSVNWHHFIDQVMTILGKRWEPSVLQN